MAQQADISVWIQRLERSPLPARTTSPDLLRQLQQSLRRPVNRVVCIATDIDPAVDLLHQVMLTQRADVLAGLQLLAQLLPVRQVVVDARYARKLGARYPSLHPSLLVRRLFRRRLKPGALPTDAGVLLLDAVGASQLGRLASDEPAGPLPIVIDDVGAQRRIRMSVPATATVGELLTQAQIDTTGKLIRHGSLMQERAVSTDTPVGQTELWLHVLHAPRDSNPESCTRCGECVVACPARIHPAALLEAAQRTDPAMGERFGLQSCIECGLCTHVCPSGLPVLASIRQLKRLPA